jgi:hypothetical protein
MTYRLVGQSNFGKAADAERNGRKSSHCLVSQGNVRAGLEAAKGCIVHDPLLLVRFCRLDRQF